MTQLERTGSTVERSPATSGESARPETFECEDEHEHTHALNWRDLNRVAFVAAAAAAVWFLGGTQNPYITGIGVICTVVGGFPIFAEAYENFTRRRMTMELSMAI